MQARSKHGRRAPESFLSFPVLVWSAFVTVMTNNVKCDSKPSN